MVMAMIYTIVGEYDLAVNELEYALSIPAWCSPEYLTADPLFAPLKKLPRFIALLKKYERKHDL